AGIAVALSLGIVGSAKTDDIADCKSDKPDIAIPACLKLLQQKNLNARGRATGIARVGYLRILKGQLDEGLADGTKAIRTDPSYPGGYYTRGFALARKGDLDRSLADFNRAGELDPKFVWAYYGRGMVYRLKRQLERAIAEFDRAIAIDPKNASVLNERG